MLFCSAKATIRPNVTINLCVEKEIHRRAKNAGCEKRTSAESQSEADGRTTVVSLVQIIK